MDLPNASDESMSRWQRSGNRASRSRSVDYVSRRRDGSEVRWRQLWIQWQNEREQERQSLSVNEPNDGIQANIAAKLDALAAQMGKMNNRQDETEQTANALVTQLTSMLSTIQAQQQLLIHHGNQMDARQQSAEKNCQTLAYQQERAEGRNDAQNREQEITQGHVQECVGELHRMHSSHESQRERVTSSERP